MVIFAGEKLSGQSRNTLAEKGQISNYLEGLNTNTNTSGNGNFQSAGASSSFNDIVYGIDASLRVHCHAPGSGTMVIQNSAPQTGIAAAPPAPLTPPGAPNLPPGPVAAYAACP